MTLTEIIEAFDKIKKEGPEKYYNAMGLGDDGINIMHDFFSTGYDLGVVAGAMYALDNFKPHHIEAKSVTLINTHKK